MRVLKNLYRIKLVMKNYFIVLMALFLFFSFVINLDASDFTWFKIASFDKQDNKTDLGGNISAWKGESGSCTFEYTDKERDSGKGYSLKIIYGVDGANQGLQLQDDGVGIKIDLKMPDLTKGHYNLVFLVKGDKAEGYTTRFKVKLESPGKEAIQMADDVIGEWKQIYLPFSMFKGDIDWNKANSMYIIFDKDTVTEKKGIIYIDAIFLN